MIDTLLVIWIATLGAERIDFLRGEGSFILTPFLVLTPVVLAVAFLRYAAFRPDAKLRLPKNTPQLALTVTILVLLVLVSVALGDERGLSLKRACLLLMQIYWTMLVAVVLHNRPDARRILMWGAYAGISLSCLFDAAQLLSLFPFPGLQWLYDIPVVNLLPPSIYPLRLAGVSIDMNRGGVLLLAYGYLLFIAGARSRWRAAFLWLAVLLIIATLSRTAVLGLLLTATAALLRGAKVRMSAVLQGMAVAGVVFALCACVLRSSPVRPYPDVETLTAERFSLSQETAGGIHLAVIERGLEVADRSVKTLLFGIGFGNAYTVLTDFYSGAKIGNFHSAYVTFLVESGAPSLIVFLVLCCLPLRRSRNYAPLMVAMIWSNVFYQLHLEPMFWFSLVLLWTNIGMDSAEARLQPQLLPRPPGNADGSH